MQTLEFSLQRILAALPPPIAETIPLVEACGRHLFADAIAKVSLPGFDNSAMDGYALRVEDVAQASADRPVSLRVIGKVAAGEVGEAEVTPGTCVRLFTGSPLPRGADGVIMQEDTRVDGAHPGQVQMLDAVKPWENIRFQGEDIKSGAVAARAGQRLTPGRLSLLAAVGYGQATVGRLPRVGLLATGSELQEPGEPLSPGQIYESNRCGLEPLVAEAGGIPIRYPLVPDTAAATRAALERAFAECDVVITSGGVSVGEFDHVKGAFQDLGGELEFWRVAIKPGKPFVFGQRRGKLLFGLPGNPISAFVTFLLLVRPALLRWQGAGNIALASHPGVLAEPLINRGDRRHFVRVQADAAGVVRPTGVQASHIVGALGEANGLVDLPPGASVTAGSTVMVLRWDWS